jgi:hypothetical protein
MKPEKLVYIDQALRALTTSDPYDLGYSTIFTVTDGRLGIVVQTDDVYIGLTATPALLFTKQRSFSHYGIEICGWYGPSECEGDTSNHLDRRSCRMIYVIDRNRKMESMMTFEDAPKDPVFNLSSRGRLAHALQLSLAHAIIAANA